MRSAPIPNVSGVWTARLRHAALAANVAGKAVACSSFGVQQLYRNCTLHAEGGARSCPSNLLARSRLYCRTARDERSSKASCDDGQVCTYSDAGVRSLAVTPWANTISGFAPCF